MLTIPQYIEVKTAAGATAAYLSPEADGLKDVWIDNELNGRCTLTFSLPLDSAKWIYLSDAYRIYAGGKEFIILNPDAIEKTRDGKKLWGKVTAHESWVLMGKKYATVSNDPQTPTPPALAAIILSGGSDLSGGLYAVGSAGHALYALLQGTGWSVGTVDVTGTHDLETEKESILANIQKVQETWGGYLVWDSVNKTVSLRDEETWAEYTGYQIRYRKNLKNITRTIDYDIITKLYPFGADDLDISSVNGGQIYLTNNSYTSEVLEGIWINQSLSDPQKLKDEATKYHEKVCRPRYNYRVKQVDLRMLPGYQHEDFDVGHVVDIVDEEVIQEYGLKYDSGYQYDTGLQYVDWFRSQTRIIGYKFNVFQPWLCDLEVGDPLEKIEAMLDNSVQAANYLDSIKTSKGQITGYKLVDESLIKQKIAAAAVDATKLNTKVVVLMGDTWADNNPAPGSVSWNQHKLYYAGVEYVILVGNTALKYIYWDGVANTYSASASMPTLIDGQFIIAVNNGGLHDTVWDKGYAREFIGSVLIAEAAILSAHIAELAVLDAHIGSVSANKIITETLSAISADLGTITAGLLNFQDPAAGQGMAVWDGATRKVLIGRLDDGTIGQEIVGGKLYSSSFRTGSKTDTTYIALEGNVFSAKVNGNTILDIEAAANDGNLFFYKAADGAQFGKILRYTDSYPGLAVESIGTGLSLRSAGNIDAVPGSSSNKFTVHGDFHSTGTLTAYDKLCTEKTSLGVIGLFTRESPEQRYIDEGRAELVNGQCIIDLLEIVPLPECIEQESDQTKWHVHLTPIGKFTPCVIEIYDSYIAIASIEPGVNGKFAWSLSATRKGKTGVRFPRMEWLVGGDEENDPVLLPGWEDELLSGVE
jgi:hypothetical protein